MTDELNNVRTMRIAEIMEDFRTIQDRISQYHVTPPPEAYHESGFGVLRQCHAEAQAVLSIHFDPGLQAPEMSAEQTERQLQRIMLDASTRRFRVQKIYLRAVAAARWLNARNISMRGPAPSRASALHQAENTLRTELASITDTHIINGLRMKDWEAGHWLDEDPTLQAIQQWIQSQ